MAPDIPPPGSNLPNAGPDNVFQGTNEGQTNVTIINGSNSAGADLARMYEADQFVPGHGNILYLAWQRAISGGTTATDFELNQLPPSFTQASRGSVTLTRTAGDLLITYDFTGGGSTIAIHAYTWLTSLTPGSTCVQPGSVPCWGLPSGSPPGGTLPASVAIASVNNFGLAAGATTGTPRQCGTSGSSQPDGCQVYDPFRAISGSGSNNATGAQPCPTSGNGDVCRYNENPVPALRFGEVAINLTAAGLFPQGSCEAFGSVFAKTRASGSNLTNQLSDVIAPVPMYVSNCLQVSVGYQDNAGGSPTSRPGPPHTLSPWGQTGTSGAVGGGVAAFHGCNLSRARVGVPNCPTDANLPQPTDGFVYDGGALMFTNTSRAAGVNNGQGQDFPVNNVYVDICSPGSTSAFKLRNLIRANTCSNPTRAAGALNCFFQPWGTATFHVPPGDGTTPGSNEMILTQTGIASTAPWSTQASCTTLTAPANLEENFDTSETIQPSLVAVLNGELVCPDSMLGPNEILPLISFYYPGPGGPQLRQIQDTLQVLNTGGVDKGCFGQNETTLPGTPGSFVPVS
jgi:hypothetical protein